MVKTRSEKKTKGHWPKGKRRNPDAGHWSRTLRALTALVDRQGNYRGISYAGLARTLGVDRATVFRWAKAIDRPAVETQELVEEWVATRRAELKTKR